MILTPEQWRSAYEESQRKEHPYGWSYRRDVANLVETLDAKQGELDSLRSDLRQLRELISRLGLLERPSGES